MADANSTIQAGLCQCGCGADAPLASKTNVSRGAIKGQPIRFIPGHNAKLKTSGTISYTVDRESGCWLWQRSVMSNGYGHLTIDNKQVLAHRHVYEQLRGPITEGLSLDHLCRNKRCVNPDHLDQVTHAENCRRGPRAKLSRADTEAIRQLSRDGVHAAEIAKRFRIHQTTARAVIAGRSWRQ